MTVKSVRNKLCRLRGVTLAAAVTALAGLGCADPAGPETEEEGYEVNLILPAGEAWVYTYDPEYVAIDPATGDKVASPVQQRAAYIFNNDGKVDILSRYYSWSSWSSGGQRSWSTKGNKLTLREIGGDGSRDTTFTIAVTGNGADQILTLQKLDYGVLRGYGKMKIQ